jgi:hypothetical protein
LDSQGLLKDAASGISINSVNTRTLELGYQQTSQCFRAIPKDMHGLTTELHHDTWVAKSSKVV